MTVSHPLPADLVELIAERFRALSEPTRIKLLDQLREGEASVLELTEAIGTTQQNVSKHLGVLQRAGIVGRRKRGNFACYSIADERVFELCETEWCPGSRRIRQRLTELGLDYLNHQVPVEREERTVLFGLTGSDTVPTLLLEDGSALVGEEEILAYLERHYAASEQADAHRVKAANARRRC